MTATSLRVVRSAATFLAIGIVGVLLQFGGVPLILAVSAMLLVSVIVGEVILWKSETEKNSGEEQTPV